MYQNYKVNFGDIKLVNFVELTQRDRLVILNWRNDSRIRKWMYTSEKIPLESHLEFIDKLNYIKTKKYFLVLVDKEKIGVIYFNDIDLEKLSAEFGLYSNPDLNGKGRLLMRAICKYAFEELNLNKLYGEVFANNERAIRLYMSCNFNKIGRKIVNNKEIICMELKSENREV